MRTDETLRLRLAELHPAYHRPHWASAWIRVQCAETRANVEYARAQVAEERAALPTIEEASGLLGDFSTREYMAHLRDDEGITRE